MTTTDYAQIPPGLYVRRSVHEGRLKPALFLCLKTAGVPWHDEHHVPLYGADILPEEFAPFWQWAVANLPVWDKPGVVKTHH